MRLILHYNLRSLRIRAWGTLATLLSAAIVTCVFCYLLAFADGLRRALTVTADPYNLIVLAEGATAESNSALPRPDADRLASVPGLAADPTGRPLVSPEVAVQTNLARRGDRSGCYASVAVRGVDVGTALLVHPAVQLTAGRWFEPGADEVVAGQSAARQFAGLDIGSEVACGDRIFRIVGLFKANGSAHESELWGHLSNVAAAYRRDMYSCASLRLRDIDDQTVQEAVSRIGSSAFALRAVREEPYYSGQSENARLIRAMALLLMAIMGAGAVFAAANAMYAAFTSRLGELTMLRAIGFRGTQLILGLVAESMCLAVAGGLCGCAALKLWLAWEGGGRDLVGTTTFTSVAFTMRITGRHLLYSLSVAAIIGITGGLWPAHRMMKSVAASALRPDYL